MTIATIWKFYPYKALVNTILPFYSNLVHVSIVIKTFLKNITFVIKNAPFISMLESIQLENILLQKIIQV